ncbi:MAG TPA: methylated-DNA--[protein]-cysteine S-methyltransferase [Candidatus Acidoferrum sp.]|nr:methylated-DNA--[protein]-cysteine S-methyltransferase [Candidatus Acidoferrum sp.]
MKTLYVHSFTTKIGRLRVASTDNGLALVGLPSESDAYFRKQTAKHFPGYEIVADRERNQEAESQLMRFVDGELRDFTLKLDWRGTPFQIQALKAVARIPYGKVKTYGEIAKALGKPGASRAVGHANASNLLPLVVPCHRVVASNGLGGYGGGIELKRRLLEMEGAL